MSTPIAGRTPIGSRVAWVVQTLTPEYFALTMAGGITSVGLALEGFSALSAALLTVCGVSCAMILVLSLVRFRADMRRDFLDAARAFGFYPSLPERTCSACAWGWPGGRARRRHA